MVRRDAVVDSCPAAGDRVSAIDTGSPTRRSERTMNTTRKAITSQAPLLLSAWLCACGGGGDTGAAAPTEPPAAVQPIATPEPTPAPVPGPAPADTSERGKAILYLSTSQSGTTYDPMTGITIEHAGLSVIRYVPELGRASLFATSSSHDYARNVLVPYTVDDRVFLRQGDPSGTGSTQRWTEVDPLATSAVAGTGHLLQDGSYLRGCGAVVGSSYYFEGYPITDVFRRTSFGDFRVAVLGQTTTSPLLPQGDPDHCRNHLASAGGKLYDAEFDAATGKVLLHRRDAATGRIAETVSLTPDDAIGWGYHFSFDDGVAYFARQRATDGRLQVFRHAFGRTAGAELVYDATDAGFALNGMDSDDGKVLLWDSKGKLLVVDVSTGRSEVHRTDFTISEAQILVLRP
jgi:hypothetical protein